MLRQTILITAFIFLAASATVSANTHAMSSAPEAGTEWTLADCINYALDNNIEIKKQMLNVETDEVNEKQAKLNFIPSLGVGSSYSYSFGRASDPTTNQFNDNFSSLSASASASTTLFAGMQKHHSLKIAQLTLQSTVLDSEKAQNDLSLTIVAAYMDVLLAEENVAIYEASLETQRLQVEETQKKVDAGKSTISDLLQMQSDYAETEYQLIAYRNSRTLAYFMLCQHLEIRDYESFRIVSPERFSTQAGSLPASKDEILESAMELPQVRSSIVNMDLAERNIRLAKSSYWPTLSFSLGYGSSFSNAQKGYNFSDQIKDNKGGSLGLSLNIPIFNSLQIRNNVTKSRISYRMAEYNYQSTVKQLNEDVERAYIDAQGALAQFNSSGKNTVTSEEAFRTVEQKYRLGAATPVDYNKALTSMITAKSQFVQSKYTYMLKLRILEFYMGKPLNAE